MNLKDVGHSISNIESLDLLLDNVVFFYEYVLH